MHPTPVSLPSSPISSASTYSISHRSSFSFPSASAPSSIHPFLSGLCITVASPSPPVPVSAGVVSPPSTFSSTASGPTAAAPVPPPNSSTPLAVHQSSPSAGSILSTPSSTADSPAAMVSSRSRFHSVPGSLVAAAAAIAALQAASSSASSSPAASTSSSPSSSGSSDSSPSSPVRPFHP